MTKVINVPFTIVSNEYGPGEIIIHGKRILSYIPTNTTYPCILDLYNWHELCCIRKVHFFNETDVKNSITGIALSDDKLLIQIYEKRYSKHVQEVTSCPKWLSKAILEMFPKKV